MIAYATKVELAEIGVNGRISGPEICRLMRRNKVTISAAAKRWNVTQSRIREARDLGVVGDQMMLLDWIQIAGC